ncbi:MAG: heme-binding beta-barrel domain-containing protein [Porticoccaceae bacterium]
MSDLYSDRGNLMGEVEKVNYGPLTELIGVWHGDKGHDVSPEPDGIENSPYYETITFAAAGDVTNAESQLLTALHYRQIVQRKSNDEIFHDQTGYWIWDAERGMVMHSLTIPRAVSVLAGGIFNGKENEDGKIVLEVSASLDDKNWKIIQSPFMQENASTTKFDQTLIIGNGKLSYSQTMVLDIYGRIFEHTDKNELLRQ